QVGCSRRDSQPGSTPACTPGRGHQFPGPRPWSERGLFSHPATLAPRVVGRRTTLPTAEASTLVPVATTLGLLSTAEPTATLTLGSGHLRGRVPQRGADLVGVDLEEVRFSPCWVSKERCFSLPCTMTRMPLVRVSAMFSAYWRHTVQVRNMASPSRHSPAWRSKVRGVEATRHLATAIPLAVKRSSGSSTRFPVMVIWVSPAMGAP